MLCTEFSTEITAPSYQKTLNSSEDFRFFHRHRNQSFSTLLGAKLPLGTESSRPILFYKGTSARTLSNGNHGDWFNWFAAVSSPISHESGTFFEQITASASRLCFISERVCQRHLGNFSRIVCRLGAPVPKGGAEAMNCNSSSL